MYLFYKTPIKGAQYGSVKFENDFYKNMYGQYGSSCEKLISTYLLLRNICKYTKHTKA